MTEMLSHQIHSEYSEVSAWGGKRSEGDDAVLAEQVLVTTHLDKSETTPIEVIHTESPIASEVPLIAAQLWTDDGSGLSLWMTPEQASLLHSQLGHVLHNVEVTTT